MYGFVRAPRAVIIRFLLGLPPEELEPSRAIEIFSKNGLGRGRGKSDLDYGRKRHAGLTIPRCIPLIQGSLGKIP